MTVPAVGTPAPTRYGARRGVGIAVVLVAVLLVWEASARALSGAYVLAAPSEIAVTMWTDADLLWRALLTTGRAAVIGFVLGNLAAVLLAGVAVLLPVTERVITAVALVVFCLPLVATGPVLRVVFGPGDGPQIVLAALAVYYTTMIPLLVGVRAAPSTWFDLVRSYGRGRAAQLRYVRARAAVPYLVAGLQIAAPAAFLGAMVGEFTGAAGGMGVLTLRASRDLDIELTWALAVIATAVSVIAYAAIGALGRRVDGDRPPLILAPARAPASRRHRTRDALLTAVGAAAVLLVLWWGGIHAIGLSPFFARTPADVVVILSGTADGGEVVGIPTGFRLLDQKLLGLHRTDLVILAAGRDQADIRRDDLEVFDPDTGTFSLANAVLSATRAGHTASLVTVVAAIINVICSIQTGKQLEQETCFITTSSAEVPKGIIGRCFFKCCANAL